MDRNQEGALCPKCERNNEKHYLKFLFINLNEMVLKCESSICLYPFKDFKYKNVKSGKITQLRFPQSPKSKTTENYSDESTKIELLDFKNEHDVQFLERTTTSAPSENVFDSHLIKMQIDEQEIEEKVKIISDVKIISNNTIKLETNPSLFNNIPLRDSNNLNTFNDVIVFDFPEFLECKPQTIKLNRNDDESVNIKIKQNAEIPIYNTIKVEDDKKQISTVNIPTATSTNTSATISRYLELIKAKHKKPKKGNTKFNVKGTNESKKILKVEDGIQMKHPTLIIDKKQQRPLDILKSIQQL